MAAQLPPAPLNAIPSGLLSFFNMKQLGRNPEQLTRELYATFDCEEFYMAGKAQLSPFAFTFALPAGTTGLSIGSNIVPAGEVWLIANYHVRLNGAGAGERVVGAPALGHPSSAGAFDTEIIGPQVDFTGVATVSGIVAPMDQSNRWKLMMPGTGFGWHTSLWTGAGNLGVLPTLYVVRLQGP